MISIVVARNESWTVGLRLYYFWSLRWYLTFTIFLIYELRDYGYYELGYLLKIVTRFS